MTGPHERPHPAQRPPYPPPYAPPYYGPPAPPAYGWHPRPRNGVGVAGMVLGIVGLVFSFVPLANLVIGLPCCVVGACLSGVGMQNAAARTADNRGQAVTGMTCACVGLALMVLLIVLGATMPR